MSRDSSLQRHCLIQYCILVTLERISRLHMNVNKDSSPVSSWFLVYSFRLSNKMCIWVTHKTCSRPNTDGAKYQGYKLPFSLGLKGPAQRGHAGLLQQKPRKEHSQKEQLGVSTCSDQMTVGHFHRWDHSWSAPPAVQMAKGVIWECSTGERSQKRKSLFGVVFPRLGWSCGNLRSLARYVHQDRPCVSALVPPWDQS